MKNQLRGTISAYLLAAVVPLGAFAEQEDYFNQSAYDSEGSFEFTKNIETEKSLWKEPVSLIRGDPKLNPEIWFNDVEIWRPEGKGPFPAVVMMHGCGGASSADTFPDWGNRYKDMGYVSVLVDGFSSRGFSHQCRRYGANFTRATVLDRVRDAYRALHMLADHPDIDPNRIYIHGWSNGGAAVLSALTPDIHEWIPGTEDNPEVWRHRFAGGIAYYPPCGHMGGSREFSAPLLIVIGEDDDWTWAHRCKPVVNVKAGDRKGEILVIENATHSFDLMSWDGYHTTSRSRYGARMVPNQNAKELAIKRVKQFLRSIQ